MNCKCGHSAIQHIYEVGACRPGFVCESGCKQFDSTTLLTQVCHRHEFMATGSYTTEDENPRCKVCSQEIDKLRAEIVNLTHEDYLVQRLNGRIDELTALLREARDYIETVLYEEELDAAEFDAKVSRNLMNRISEALGEEK